MRSQTLAPRGRKQTAALVDAYRQPGLLGAPPSPERKKQAMVWMHGSVRAVK